MIGQNISHYKILEKIGEGGMGIVYKALDSKLKRTVVLKFSSNNFKQNSEAQQRFIHEAQAAEALNYPNICTIYEIDVAEGQPFISMEYIKGQSLEEKIKAGPLKLDEILNIAIQVAQGLEEAHDKSVIHRDIKSANIMLTAKGSAKIMDFGLAQLSLGGSMLTKEGTTLGTLAYMAPEQARGEKVDQRADIWALGVVLYEMISGLLPFCSDHDQMIAYAILQEDPAPLTTLRKEVPLELERIVEKTLAKNPDQRYQNVTDLLVDLRLLHEDYKTNSFKFSPSGQNEKNQPSIAIMPFINMNRDEENEFFSDGITEDIITALSKLKRLRVAARSSAFQFKNKTPELREIGQRLKVNSVLMGSVRRAGKRLRITVQLCSIMDGYEIWSERYDRVSEDIFDIQDEISQAVVNALKVKLLENQKKQMAKRYTENVEAYNLYLKGRFYWNKRAPDAIKKAKDSFKQALIKDPNYALAHSGLADCYAALVLSNEILPPKQIMPESRRAALKALEIDSTLAEAYASLAFGKVLYDWDWKGAENDLKRATDLNPAYASAFFWQAIFVLVGTGRTIEAEAAARRAIEIDPISPTINIGPPLVLFFQREYQRAIEESKKVIELDPDYPYAHLFLGRSYIQQGEYEKGFASIDKAKLLTFREGHLGYGYAVSDRPEDAQKLLTELAEKSRPEHIAAYQIALIYSGLGENDRAFEWLEKACEQHSPQLVWLKLSPEFEPLHSDLRWNKLLTRLGLSE